jgi:hypothetical protein
LDHQEVKDVSARILLETKLVGEIDQDIFDFLLGERNVGILIPRGLKETLSADKGMHGEGHTYGSLARCP